MFYIVLFGLSVIAGSLLREFWWGVVAGLTIDLVLFLWNKYGIVFKTWRQARRAAKTKEPSASSTTPAGKPAEKKSYGKLIGWSIILLIVGWSWFSIENEVGFPGNYVATKSYQHSVTIGITEEAFQPAGQQFCGEGLRPGKWKFMFPREVELEKWHKTESGFRTRNPDGSTNTPHSFISRVRINKVMSGEERVVIGDDDCFRVFIKAPPGAVMLGNPVFHNGKAVPFGPDSEPKPAIVTVRFFS